MRRLFVFSALVSLCACYSFQPVAGSATPVVGQDIQVNLNPQGTVELARYLGPGINRADGRLVSLGANGEMNVAVDFVSMTNGMKQPWSGEGSVIFPRAYVEGIRERKFEKRRTIMGSTVLAAGVIGIAIVAIKSGGGTPGEGGGTPPGNLRPPR